MSLKDLKYDTLQRSAFNILNDYQTNEKKIIFLET